MQDKKLLYRLYQLTQKLISMDAIKADCLPYAQRLLPLETYITVGIGVLFGLPNDQRLAYSWHQESNYMPNYRNVLNFWFPIFENATRDNGTMSCLSGSHRLGKLPYDKKKASDDSYTDLIPKGIDDIEKKYDEYHFLTEQGDLVMLHHDMVHRSNANRANRTRFSGIIRIASVERVPDIITMTNQDY